MTEWQPIETAPKDGTRFVAKNADGFECETYWYVHPSVKAWITDEFDCNEFDWSPTHWHPHNPAEDGST